MACTVLTPAVGRRHSIELRLLGRDAKDLSIMADLIVSNSMTCHLIRVRHNKSPVILSRSFQPYA